MNDKNITLKLKKIPNFNALHNFRGIEWSYTVKLKELIWPQKWGKTSESSLALA